MPDNFLPPISLVVAEENKSDSWSLTHPQTSNLSKEHRIHTLTYFWTKQLKKKLKKAKKKKIYFT